MANKKLYTGSTANLQNRLANHQSGKVPSTKPFLPVKPIHYETYYFKSDAQRRERFLKTTEGKRLLKQQIRDVLTQFKYLSSR